MDENNFKTIKVNNESDVFEFYDQYSSEWDNRFGRYNSTTYFFKNRWISFCKVLGSDAGSKLALDLGVGTGDLVDKTSKLFEEIIAVDASRGMLRMLEDKLKSKQILNVTTLHSNVRSIPSVADSSANVVYFTGLMEHIVDIDAFAREVARLLCPGGVVVGVIANGRCPWYGIRRLLRGTGKHCSTDRYYSLSEVKKIFSKYGLEFVVADFWGCVPPGTKSNALFESLRFIEGLLKFTLVKYYFGSVTFKFKKT